MKEMTNLIDEKTVELKIKILLSSVASSSVR
jgi:hypothetical protein